MELKVIKNTNLSPKQRKNILYAKAYTRLIDNVTPNGEVEIGDLSKENLLKLAYMGVMYISSLDIPNTADYSIKLAVFELAQHVKEYLKFLTPNDLLIIFPIEKTYDGEKRMSKDYYFTMEVLQNHGLDNLIGESLDDILWDYENYDLRMFMLRMISFTTALHKEQTGVDPIEEFLNGMGIPTYSQEIMANGQEYIVNRQTGETTAIETKKKPAFKVLSGK